MKSRIFILVLAIMLVAAFAFARGGGEKPVTTTTAPGEPQYGGRITAWMHESSYENEPPSPDIMDGYWNQMPWLWPMQESPVWGDIEKYAGEYDFWLRGYIPAKYLGGCLLEDWEVTNEKLIWQVRPGVYWQGRDVMESREMTAEDVVADLLYFREAPGGKSFKRMTTGNIYTTGEYSLEIEFASGLDLNLMYIIGYEDRALISPPELVEMGVNDSWEHQVGTGPYMLKEYKPGSHMLYEKNPNYWGKTTIDGKEYQLPFSDEFLCPLIPDESTQIAAVRTAKLEWMELVPSAHWGDLVKVKGLNTRFGITSGVAGYELKCNEPPFDDVNVRRAMMIGTDTQAFIDALGIEEYTGAVPKNFAIFYVGDPTVYTPLEKLPEENRELWEYNPEKAKKMLADAGYPNGFKAEVVIDSTQPLFADRVSLLKGQWEKLGVELDVKAFDRTTWEGIRYSRSYKQVFTQGLENAGPEIVMSRYYRSGAVLNVSTYSNSEVDRLIDTAMGTIDAVERIRLLKEAALIAEREVSVVPVACNTEGHVWWPWIVNHHGALNNLDRGGIGVLARCWVDQALKKEMGF
jgi:peptide/nickel transport system substrate-binding protein